jgi:hypothetical protein
MQQITFLRVSKICFILKIFILKIEPLYDDFYENRFASENMNDEEMYADNDGRSLDDFNDLDDFEKEQVFGEDEDYDLIFRGDEEDVFSIYGENGGIVGARLAVSKSKWFCNDKI